MHRSASHATASLRVPADAELTIRPARGGHVLLAELDGRIVAAVSTHDGRAVADPFVPSAEIVEQLRLHASASRPARAKVRIPRPWMPRLVLRGVATTAA
jgi:hypothetical protein